LNDKEILIEVFDSNRELLISGKVDPRKKDNQLGDSNTFQISLKMTGRKWQVGEEYVARATYDLSYSEDSFTIDQRMSVLQSDKSVYTIGGDMIVTVIDPDADKDSQKIEFVGNREDSKLIIEGKHGKINGYRLMETDKSTAIFQGIIGFLRARNDGTVIPQKYEDEIIDKTQGTGIEDGYIAGMRGEEILLTYTSPAGTARLTVFLSDFGALVELDQKTYKPNDKVSLVLVHFGDLYT